jgi:hypothetical protein
MPRFVLLRHELPAGASESSHWDLMLEDGDVLLTWRFVELPTETGGPVAAVKLADHRREYLTYEGPVSGGRGEVRRVDAGEFAWVLREVERVEIDATGELLLGRVVLEWAGGAEWRGAHIGERGG